MKEREERREKREERREKREIDFEPFLNLRKEILPDEYPKT
jgi:hypothetical protein